MPGAARILSRDRLYISEQVHIEDESLLQIEDAACARSLLLTEHRLLASDRNFAAPRMFHCESELRARERCDAGESGTYQAHMELFDLVLQCIWHNY